MVLEEKYNNIKLSELQKQMQFALVIDINLRVRSGNVSLRQQYQIPAAYIF
jgi:hypothetical protein